MKNRVVIGGDLKLVSQIDGEASTKIEGDGSGSAGTVPPDYVGEDVPRRGADDLTVDIQDYKATRPIPTTFKNNSIVVAEGYYPNLTTKIDPFGEMEVGEATSVEIDNEGKATIQFSPSKHGIAYEVEDYTLTKEHAVNVFASDFYTPAKEPIILVTQNKYCIDNITILPIPDQYEIYNWMGSQAELVSEIYPSTITAYKDCDFNTWAPSTTAATIKATETAGTFTADFSQYEYFLRWDCDARTVYNDGTATKTRVEENVAIIFQSLIKRPNSIANISADNFNGNACSTYRTIAYTKYYTTKSALTYTWSSSYGVYAAATAATFANGTDDSTTVTVKTPAWSARCSTTYFSTASAGAVDKTNSKFRMRGRLYRMKIGSPERSMFNELVDLINTPIT